VVPMEFNNFNPSISDPSELPSKKGIYIVTANSTAALPIEMRKLNYRTLNDRPVIYIGIASDLRRRDYKNHFGGTARNSTLRRSVGSLFNLRREQYPNEVGTNKYKFVDEDEEVLSSWMKDNLILHYFVTDKSEELEEILIREYHPPLNINKNKSNINKEFRTILKNRRYIGVSQRRSDF
jgi:hypothetical protein